MKRKLLSVLLALVLVLSFSLVTAVPVAAAIDRLVPSTYATIQLAIDAADPGDTIIVAAETYAENVVIDKALILQGATGATIAPASGVGVEIQASDVTVDGFAIDTIGLDAHGIWVSVSAANLTITGNDITIGGGSTAIYADAGADMPAKSSGWLIQDNTLSALAGCNLELYDVDAVTIDTNIFGNTAGSNIIVSSELFDLTGPIAFTNNDVQGNDGGSMVAFVTDFQQYVTHTRSDTADTDMDSVTVVGNTFAGWAGWALRFGDWGGPVTNAVVNSNTFNMTTAGEVIGGTDAPSATGTGNTFNVSPPATIQGAIDEAFAGDTIKVAAGRYEEGLIDIEKSITISGDPSDKPVISPTTDTDHATHRGWFQVTGLTTVVDFKNLEFNGSGQNIENAIRYQEGPTGTVANCDFSNISWSTYVGFAVVYVDYSVLYETGPALDLNPDGYVKGCTFTNIERIGVSVFGVDQVYLQNNTYTGKGDVDGLDYGIEVGGGGVATIEQNNTITNCTGVAESDGSTSAGILVTTYFGLGTEATIIGNTLSGNTEGIAVGYGESDTSVVVAHKNNIVGNTLYGIGSTEGPSVDATNNWWGHSSGPIHVGTNPLGTGNEVSSNVDFEPWLLVKDGPAYDMTRSLPTGWSLVSPDGGTVSATIVDSVMVLEYTGVGFTSELTDPSPLKAIYVKTVSGGGAGVNYAVIEPGEIYSKDLVAGWNLISVPSYTDSIQGILAQLRYATIGTQQGVGLTTLVSQGEYNQNTDSFQLPTLTDAQFDALPGLSPLDGYWAHLEADETFEVIPQ